MYRVRGNSSLFLQILYFKNHWCNLYMMCVQTSVLKLAPGYTVEMSVSVKKTPRNNVWDTLNQCNRLTWKQPCQQTWISVIALDVISNSCLQLPSNIPNILSLSSLPKWFLTVLEKSHGRLKFLRHPLKCQPKAHFWFGRKNVVLVILRTPEKDKDKHVT